ncbi:MAG: hypothetical protein HOE43_08080 [Chloroflexi bacterium]|jgi:hypothetical protein|nr:hypothetical protein [Chloroflexota bacterium]
MSKQTLKYVVFPILVVVLLASASITVHASTEDPIHAYTTTDSGVKVGFGYGLLALGGIALFTFLSRAILTKTRR